MKIKTIREFSGVPAGTTGTAERDGKLWKVTWNLTHEASGLPRTKPLVDWFDNEEFENYLVEI